MVVNIEKVSQWPRVWRNHFSSEWKGYLLTTENAYSLPVPVLKGKTGGDSLPEGWTGFETDFGIESETLDPISIFPWESI